MCHQPFCKDCSVGRRRSLNAVDMSRRKIKVNIAQRLCASPSPSWRVYFTWVASSMFMWATPTLSSVHHTLPKQAVISLFPTEVELMFLCSGKGQNLLCFPLFTICYQIIYLFCNSRVMLSARYESSRSCDIGLDWIPGSFTIAPNNCQQMTEFWPLLVEAEFESEGKSCHWEAWSFERKPIAAIETSHSQDWRKVYKSSLRKRIHPTSGGFKRSTQISASWPFTPLWTHWRNLNKLRKRKASSLDSACHDGPQYLLCDKEKELRFKILLLDKCHNIHCICQMLSCCI